MKAGLAILAITVGLLCIGTVNADSWNAIGSGYAVTTDWHGEAVPIGEPVTVWAGTTDANIVEVLFRWRYPDDTVFTEVTVEIDGPYTTPNVPAGVPDKIVDWANAHPGITVYYANDTQIPDTLGDWGITAFFIGPGGKTKAGVEDTIAIRATSFEVVPELAIIGTAGAAAAMLLGLGFVHRKNSKP